MALVKKVGLGGVVFECAVCGDGQAAVGKERRS